MLPASFKISLRMLAECTVPKITGEKKRNGFLCHGTLYYHRKP